MRYLLLFFITFPVLASNYISSGDVLKCNNKETGVSTYTSESGCLEGEQQSCHKIDGKPCRYHKVVGSEYQFDQPLKDAYDAEKAAEIADKAAKATKKSEGEDCLRDVDTETINPGEQIQLLGCLIKIVQSRL